MIGASAIALAVGARAPGASAQEAPSAPDTAAAVPAAASGAAQPGASVRKTPDAAPGGASAIADDTTATTASSPSAGATPGADASAADTSAADASAGATSSSEAAATAAVATPEATAGAEAPSVTATPATHAKARTRARARADADSVTDSKAAKADSKTASAQSKDDKGGKGQESPFSSLQFAGNKGPIDIKSDALDLDYKGNVVTFRGHVRAAQADAILTSDTLTVTYGKDFHEVKQMVANNNVRMSQGTRWATGDRAVLDQAGHTVTLTGSPVVHDGDDQVAGTKITVHLDTGKSEVEGARAVFFPKEQKTRDNKTTVAKSP